MRTDQRNVLLSKAGFALLEVVMTIIIVGLAMGTAAMVLGTAVKVVQMRTALDNRNLAAENCMARIEAAFQGRPVAELDELDSGAASVCKPGVTVNVTFMSMDDDGKDSDERKNYAAKFYTSNDSSPSRPTAILIAASFHILRSTQLLAFRSSRLLRKRRRASDEGIFKYRLP